MNAKKLLQKLVQVDSTLSQGEQGAALVLADYFKQADIPACVDVWDSKRANCQAHIKGEGSRQALLFLCHLDVVPPGDIAWEHPPFSGLELGGHIHGRGTTDMKGGTVAAAVAMRELIEEGETLKGDLLFAATAGEETDSCGVERFVGHADGLPDLAGIIIPEPTDFAIINAHRGLLWLQITTHGKTAHGSAPHLGINAIRSMAKVMDLLVEYPLPSETHAQLGSCSMSINTIAGGNALNVVPDQCTLGVDIRTLPGQSHCEILNDLHKRFDQMRSQDSQFHAEVSIVRSVGALETDPEASFVRTVCDTLGIPETKAVGFTTDAPSVIPLGAPILIFGPGQGSQCHQPNESIAMADVDKAITLYKQLIRKFLL